MRTEPNSYGTKDLKFEHLWFEKISLTGRPGHTINESFREAYDFARENHCIIEVTFNGSLITIDGRTG